MHSAGARALREDDNEMSREAVLLQWERKIEAAERREDERAAARRADRGRLRADRGQPPRPTPAEPVPLRPERRDAPRAAPLRAQRPAPSAVPAAPAPEPRRRAPHDHDHRPARRRRRRRRAVVDAQLAQPDRIALWAFLLGLFLVAVAAGTAHA